MKFLLVSFPCHLPPCSFHSLLPFLITRDNERGRFDLLLCQVIMAHKHSNQLVPLNNNDTDAQIHIAQSTNTTRIASTLDTTLQHDMTQVTDATSGMMNMNITNEESGKEKVFSTATLSNTVGVEVEGGNGSEENNPPSTASNVIRNENIIINRNVNTNTNTNKNDNEDDENEWNSVIVGGCLIPPTNFGLIEKDMYRSGLVNELNFTFLEHLHLRTIVYLSSEEPTDRLQDFIDDQNIHLEQLVDEMLMSEDVVLSAMHVLLDVSMHPVLVMCSHGRHRTGTIIGCLRKLQRWSLSAIFEEYDRHADGRGRLANEQFIELFDTDLINIPTENKPLWLR